MAKMGVFKFEKKHKYLDQNTSFLIWNIHESEDFFLENLNLNELEERELFKIQNKKKRLGWLAERMALKKLFNYQGYTYSGLYKNDFVYYPTNFNLGISMSHTEDFAIACLDKEAPVGIHIAKKNSITNTWFLNKEDCIIQKWGYYEPTILYSLKMAAYKAFGDSFLNIKQNVVLFYKYGEDGKVYGKIKYRPFLAYYITNDDFVISWCRKVFLEDDNLFWVVIGRGREVY